MTPPNGVEPLVWYLVTTLRGTPRSPMRSRWCGSTGCVMRDACLRHDRIEEVFRALKKDGLEIEDSQLETAGRLFNLAALGLVAATRTIQLVMPEACVPHDARDGSARPATDVINEEDIPAAAAIGASLEGATDRQKNPHERGRLAWIAWIVARLGGWNCCCKPPGPKTMARGLDRFFDRLDGYRAAAARPNV